MAKRRTPKNGNAKKVGRPHGAKSTVPIELDEAPVACICGSTEIKAQRVLREFRHPIKIQGQFFETGVLRRCNCLRCRRVILLKTGINRISEDEFETKTSVSNGRLIDN